MSSRLNIGILAHIDAGKTSLTERILFHAGVLSTMGSVDAGTTQTDTLDLERQRGITIRSAVVSFTLGERIINLIDTPGHPDFIAEVERALGVLDAVILVISAVEGVQPQTRKLFRAIAKVGLPCLIFINKIDRMGARTESVIADIRKELRANPVPLVRAVDEGTGDASVSPRKLLDDEVVAILAESDEAVLTAWVEGTLSDGMLNDAITSSFAMGTLQPVLMGSAVTGAGTDELFSALQRRFPVAVEDALAPLSAEVFKVQRDARGARSVIARIRNGSLRVRDAVPTVQLNGDVREPEKITRLEGYRDGQVVQENDAVAGDIVRLQGLSSAKIGDWIGQPSEGHTPSFDPPVFESRIWTPDASRTFDLNRALDDLVDEDPLIGLRRDPRTSETYVHLYGEVQEQVVLATLKSEYGLDAAIGKTTVLCVERLLGPGRAAEIQGETKPPFYATVGFEIRPQRGERPVWHFTPGKAKQNWYDAAEQGGRQTLREGLHGWPVIEVDVEVTDLIYLVASVPVDYRRLAELVMADAIRDAGTVVCEPVLNITVRFDSGRVSSVMNAVTSHRGKIRGAGTMVEQGIVVATLPAAELAGLNRELPGITNGKADVDTEFFDYVPVEGEPPTRARTDLNPFDRREYLARLAGQY